MFQDDRDLLIQKQAEIITKLNSDLARSIADKHREVNEIRKSFENKLIRYAQEAKYYQSLVEVIAEDEFLQDAWRNFISAVKLSVKKDIPGLTS